MTWEPTVTVDDTGVGDKMLCSEMAPPTLIPVVNGFGGTDSDCRRNSLLSEFSVGYRVSNPLLHTSDRVRFFF